MEDNFSKLKLTTSIAAIKTNLPAMLPPVKKNASKHTALLNNSRTPGIILTLFTLFLLFTPAISAQRALSGNMTAFTQLRNDQRQLSQSIMPLFHGEVPSSSSLEVYHQKWRLEAKKIDLILSHKESLLKLSNSMRAIAVIHHQLARHIDQLIAWGNWKFISGDQDDGNNQNGCTECNKKHQSNFSERIATDSNHYTARPDFSHYANFKQGQ